MDRRNKKDDYEHWTARQKEKKVEKGNLKNLIAVAVHQGHVKDKHDKGENRPDQNKIIKDQNAYSVGNFPLFLLFSLSLMHSDF